MTPMQPELEELARLLLRHKHGGDTIHPGVLQDQSKHIQEYFYGLANRIISAGYRRVKPTPSPDTEELCQEEDTVLDNIPPKVDAGRLSPLEWFTTPNPLKIQIIKNKKWSFILKHRNGSVVCRGKGYSSKAKAFQTAKNLSVKLKIPLWGEL